MRARQSYWRLHVAVDPAAVAAAADRLQLEEGGAALRRVPCFKPYNMTAACLHSHPPHSSFCLPTR